MPETRCTVMCDASETARFRPSTYIPQLHALFGAFTDYVQEQAPEVVEPFRQQVLSRFQEQTEGTEKTQEVPLLHRLFPDADELERARLRYVCRLLDIRDGDPQTVHTTTRFAGTQARLLPAYQQMRALCDLIGPDDGIFHVRGFIDRWMKQHTQTDDTLEDPSRFWDALDGEHHETSEVAIRLHRGRIAFRVNRCLWADVMRPLNDPQLAHACTCYGDFPQIYAINPNFVLTRTMTIMQGAPYCDTCIHDRRHVESIEHPDRPLFDSLHTDR